MLSHKFKRRFVQGCFKLIKVDWIVNPDVFRRVTSNVFRCGMITSLFWPTKRKESIAPKIPDPSCVYPRDGTLSLLAEPGLQSGRLCLVYAHKPGLSD